MSEPFDATAENPFALRECFDLPAGVCYLDAAAQGPRLRSVTAAGHAALAAGHAPWRIDESIWLASIERLRARVATLLGDVVDSVALVPSVAYGLATAARNLPLQAADAVLVEDTAFPSCLLTWQQRCAEVGAQLIVARRTPGGNDTDAMLAALDAHPHIRVVAVSNAHWVDGALLDLDRIAGHARAAGAALVLDLSQSVGVMPVDLARWQPAFVAFVGYKWLLGPAGLAYLWAAPAWREHGAPIEQHWSARAAGERWRFADDAGPPYCRGARRFDAGGVATPLALALADAGVAQVEAWGVDAIAARLATLTASLDAALAAQGLGDWTTPGHAPHFMGLRPPADRLAHAMTLLQANDVVCTARYGRLRIAPHLNVDMCDMARIAGILAEADSSPG